MAEIPLNKDVELVYENAKATDYLWNILEELVERTGGEFVPNEKLIAINNAPASAGDTVIYQAPSTVQNAVVNTASVTNLTAGAITVFIGISTDTALSGSDVVYNAQSVASNETFVFEAMKGLVLNASDRIIVSGSTTCAYHIAISELS